MTIILSRLVGFTKISCVLFASMVLLLSFTQLAHSEPSVTTTYYHTDVLGSIVAASDENGDVLWRKTYDSFGEEVISDSNGDELDEQAYTGKQYDAETGLVYLGQRYYDPELRRFISIDPVGFTPQNTESFNRYTYANNNPYKYVDPDGRFPVLIPLIVPALELIGAGLTGFAIGTGISDVSRGKKTVADAAKDTAIGVAVAAVPFGVGRAAKPLLSASKGKELVPFFPINDGFIGQTENLVLKQGQIIDRFGGSAFSRFFSPQGVPGPMRALPPGTADQPLRNFEVLKPFTVEAGKIAPAFNQIGLGTQFRSGKTLGELIEQGFLREVKP